MCFLGNRGWGWGHGKAPGVLELRVHTALVLCGPPDDQPGTCGLPSQPHPLRQTAPGPHGRGADCHTAWAPPGSTQFHLSQVGALQLALIEAIEPLL